MASSARSLSDKFEIGHVFSETFAVIGRNLPLFLGLSFVIGGVPQILFQSFVFSSFQSSAPGMVSTATSMTSMFSYTPLYWLALVLLNALLQAGLSRATIRDLNGERPEAGDIVSTAVSVLLPVMAINLLVTIGASLGMILLIVPGIILWLGWAIAIPVEVQEREGVFESMRRSRYLTRGSRWSLFGFFLILIIAVMFIQILLSMVTGFLSLAGGHLIGIAISTGVTSTLSTLVLSVAIPVCYVELRQVKEGTGVDELAQVFA
jgi:hypothetical protein